MEWAKILGLGTAAVLAFIVSALFGSVVVYFAWNAVVPAIFGLKAITFTQALWLSVLANSLFKSDCSGSSK